MLAPSLNPLRCPTREGFWATIEAAWAFVDVGNAREAMVNFSDNIDLTKATRTVLSKLPDFIEALTHILQYFSSDEFGAWTEHLQNFISVLDDWQIRMVLNTDEHNFPAMGAWVVAIGRRFYTAIEHEPSKYFRISGYKTGCPGLLQLAHGLRREKQENGENGRKAAPIKTSDSSSSSGPSSDDDRDEQEQVAAFRAHLRSVQEGTATREDL
ncbi:hypothetical protein CcaverHIS002_0510940 [Cutaneotrichosporon cavernicola]|uniref:Uncharacterized protein n=1 Tax=Cutaneotrichosporon cavernicola TaxID=279322 RepID=A0AA48L7W3_9TREE|nr:uncharacterized protein CcaverHIS019_0511490 [Cutaneotrichosporon cavernicola]BEI85693.1 hypothetical protein CcaverHIS002_0510940 [Cutaneotrichosporon cavernicola]BEI93521.1 hypothetical protein CcaverHIS019_0511490 [Cutaneotrichosporon cavernicola]